MSDAIISRESIRAKARSAFLAGRTRDSHGMNPGSPALHDWLTEYDRCANSVASKLIANSLPLVKPTHLQRFDVEQEQGRGL